MLLDHKGKPGDAMPTLRLIQTRIDSSQRFQVRVEWDGEAPPASATATVELEMTERDQADIQWYMEDYLLQPYAPEKQIAARIEARMRQIGEELFTRTFQGSEDARDLWAGVRPRLHETAVEISTTVVDAAALPWELLRDPRTGQTLALGAAGFVRVQSQRARKPVKSKPQKNGEVRVLLVICRPDADDDVPYRSVASRLVKGLTEQGRQRVRLEVLRPPTFARLGEVLRRAKAAGAPYHVVHFDGHGLYADAAQLAEMTSTAFSALSFKGPDEGAHGYLAFEPAAGAPGHFEPVGGTALGNLLHEAQVPVLVLNACRSAFAEGRPQPGDEPGHGEMVRAYGSLAQEVVDCGVAGVVAMRYNVYVVTAAQFIGDLYRVLAEGHSLGAAVGRGRKALADNPLRAIGPQPLPLQDWPVPVVYEAAPLHLFPKTRGEALFAIGDGAALPPRDDLPRPPDLGFFGRDETLLALDRAFDRHKVVLLHAYAGAGKTSTAAEFARWYRDTGGLGDKGLVLFDSFERRRTLRDLMDKLGGLFAPLLQHHGIDWLSQSEARRYDLALQILRQVPLLWIWDNVEPVAGFPAGAESSWSAEEQRDLADFLRDLAAVGAKVLLTSRRDEHGWLGDLPTRIPMPPMPPWERRALAEELLRRHNRPASDVRLLEPLLRFSAGNPMTLTVVVGQALRDLLETPAQIDAYVARLRAGEAAFPDDAAQGRDRSLGASLDYGFQAAFSPEDRCRLAVLHLFQGVVNVVVLCRMGDPEAPWCLDSLRGLSHQAGIALLDRAAEIGLLMPLSKGTYGIHPAVPWFLARLFADCYPAPAEEPIHAYVESVGGLGNFYQQKFDTGHHQVLGALQAEEHNLLHARRLALARDWWQPCFKAMQGLRALYTSSGQWAGWQRLVDEAAPLVTATDGGPRPGREMGWGLAIDHAVGLAGQRHDRAEGERLLRLDIEVGRCRTAGLRELPADRLAAEQRNRLRSLAVSLERLGSIQNRADDPKALMPLGEAHSIYQHIKDTAAEAIAAFNLGQAYLEIAAVRDLDQAERWVRASLDLHAEHDRAGRARCHSQLGAVAIARFQDLRQPPGADRQILADAWDAAVTGYRTALDLAPATEQYGRAVCHGQLAILYDWGGHPDAAVEHYTQAIRLNEDLGNRHGAGVSRFNLADLLLRTGRLPQALAYARTARDDFAEYLPHTAAAVAKAEALIAKIELALAAAS